MTNKEILQADILDIVFENRNKSYGAYALRRNYNTRLGRALGGTLGVVLIMILISANSKTGKDDLSNSPTETVTTFVLPKEKIKEPEIIHDKIKPAKPVAQVRSSAVIQIVRDELVSKPEVPDIDDLKDKVISNANVIGDIPSDPNAHVNNVVPGNDVGNKKPVEAETAEDFKKNEREPEFPGGKQGLMRFFSRTLNTPDELEAGEKKIILVHFMVDANGLVSNIEIVQSGGDKYDREVIRAFRKMPKWSPAIQNGHSVSVYFTQPVTFVGIEQ